MERVSEEAVIPLEQAAPATAAVRQALDDYTRRTGRARPTSLRMHPVMARRLIMETVPQSMPATRLSEIIGVPIVEDVYMPDGCVATPDHFDFSGLNRLDVRAPEAPPPLTLARLMEMFRRMEERQAAELAFRQERARAGLEERPVSADPWKALDDWASQLAQEKAARQIMGEPEPVDDTLFYDGEWVSRERFAALRQEDPGDHGARWWRVNRAQGPAPGTAPDVDRTPHQVAPPVTILAVVDDTPRETRVLVPATEASALDAHEAVWATGARFGSSGAGFVMEKTYHGADPAQVTIRPGLGVPVGAACPGDVLRRGVVYRYVGGPGATAYIDSDTAVFT